MRDCHGADILTPRLAEPTPLPALADKRWPAMRGPCAMEVIATDQQRRLAENMAALRAAKSKLADQVDALPADQAVQFFPARNGMLTGRVHCEDGADVLLASAWDPAAEARQWADALEDLDEDKHTVAVTGCGLGYHVAELLGRRPGGLVVVLEPSLAMVHAALQCHDFTRDILVHRVVFVVAGDRTDMFEPLAPHNPELMLGTRLMQHPATGRARPTACAEIQRSFTEYVQFARSGMVTTLQISAATCENILLNLPHYLSWPDITPLRGAWKGSPGICVAAGPSLRRNMHLLRQVKGKAPIIAVQTVLKTLLSAGIRPDFITALDYSPLSLRFYEGLEAVDDVTLVADPKVNSVVPANYPGPMRMFYNYFADRVLAEMPEDHDRLPAGSTVAHLNLYLARYMGCDPIVLIGQDLGFGENVYYSPGTPIQTTWSPELNRFNSMEMMEWQRIVRVRTQLRKVPGQRRPEIYTDSQMFTYLQQFERDIASTDAKVINATEGGARIAGAEEMPLAEVIRRYCRPSGKPAPQLPQRRPDAPARAAEAVVCLNERLGELDRMEEVCDHVLAPLREMADALDEPGRFNELHAEMNQWRIKIDSLKGAYQLVADVVQLAELKRFQLDKARARRELDEIAERRDQLARDIQYVSIIREGVDILRGNLTDAVKRLEETA